MIGKSCFLDSLRIKEISKVQIDFSFISEHNGDQFSPIEELFFDELSKRNIISKNARHGITDNKKCDIVDEENELQIEVVTEFKNRIKKTKTPQKDFDSLGLECVGNIFIQPSDALLKKYYDKSYTDKYKKHLAIYCIGNQEAVLGLAYTMRENIKQKGAAKNRFENLYIIWNDFTNKNRTYLMYFGNNGDQPIIEEIATDISLIKKCGRVAYSELKIGNSGTHYFLDAESIFMDATPAIGILPGREIIKLVKEFRIAISPNE